MQDITLPSITPTKQTATEGGFTIEPLYPGYGTTIGTALRRVLLSSLPGAAITSVRITGVDHEFSTISGIKEDVIEIILNLKGVRFQMDGDEPITTTITKSGPGKITAADITATDRLKVANPKIVIATLADKKASFDAEVTIEKSRGYLAVERREEQKLPVGTIAIDASFSPVRRVNFSVDNTRVGQMTNFDRLHLEVATDETLSPEDAVKEAAKILVSQFQLFVDPSQAPAQAPTAAAVPTPEMTVEDADLSARTTNALINNDLKTMQDVAKLSDDALNNLKGLGKKAVDEVIAKLAELGIARNAN